MKVLRLVFLFLLCSFAFANAGTLTAEGGLLEPTHGYNTLADRYLVNDGDFEGGTCIDTPTWTCTTDNACDWIADLAPLGLWNYSGAHVAWLGGFCGNATIYTYICQDLELYGTLLTWFWMAYVNNGGELITVTIDGDIVFTYITAIADHLLDYQPQYVNLSYYSGVHTLCFNYDLQVAGDNYFLDYVEIRSPTSGTESVAFSTVKALY